MASTPNYNTVWASIFEPLSTFGSLGRFGRGSEFGARHDLPYHIIGSDAAAVVLRVGQDPDIVFELPGRTTFGASASVVKRGGIVVTCASTTGYLHEDDNRHLWTRLKRIIGSHFANYDEAYQANRLVELGMVHPILSKVSPLEQTAQGAYEMHHHLHASEIGILVGAPKEGLGVRDEAARVRHLEGITAYRDLS